MHGGASTILSRLQEQVAGMACVLMDCRDGDGELQFEAAGCVLYAVPTVLCSPSSSPAPVICANTISKIDQPLVWKYHTLLLGAV